MFYLNFDPILVGWEREEERKKERKRERRGGREKGIKKERLGGEINRERDNHLKKEERKK